MENNTGPDLTLKQAQAVVETKTAPRITQEIIESRIDHGATAYYFHGTLTMCVLTMVNGFKVVGKAAPADDRNFDAEVGQRYAYEDAFRQLWQLEGYRLCEELHKAELMRQLDAQQDDSD